MALKPDQWMPFDVRSYLGDTMHLDRGQHGAYLLLLFAYWMRGAALNDNDNELSAIAKASSPDWRRLRPILSPFFDIKDGKWCHRRVERDLARARELIGKKSESGKKGAEKRWRTNSEPIGDANGKAMAEPLADEKQRASQTDATSPSNLTIPIEKTESSDFDCFFAAYPKQEQRDNAVKIYAEVVAAGASPASLVAAAKRFSAHIERDKIQAKFVPQAKNWLGNGNWKDWVAPKEAEIVLPELHPSWPADVVKRWVKNLGEITFRTYFGPAEYVDADPVRLCYRSKHLRRLAEEHCPQVVKEVALEIAA